MSFTYNSRRNIIEHGDEDLKTCRYNDSNIYCPIFSLGQIVDMIEEEQNFTELSIKVLSFQT